MGASPWSYYVPYQEDISAAFRNLQLEIFTRGEYEKSEIDIGWLEELEFFTASDEEREALYKTYGLATLREPFERLGATEFGAWLEHLNAQPEFESLDEFFVVRCISSSPTDTVLDYHISYAMPEDQVIAHFGTHRATRRHLSTQRDFWDSIGRGNAIAIVLYDDDMPDEIFFLGYTFD